MSQTDIDAAGDSLGLRLIYFAPADLQTARVDRNCIVKFCEALAARHVEVTLVSVAIKALESEPTASRTIWDVFGVRHTFRLFSVGLPLRQKHVDSSLGNALLRIARTLIYPPVAARLLVNDRRSCGATALYTKNYGVMLGLRLVRGICARRSLIVFEAHLPPRNRFQRWVLAAADGVVCNGHAVHQALREMLTTEVERLFPIHQGCDLEPYPTENRTQARRAARQRLGWGEADKIVAYTGKIYWPYEEVDLLLQAASLLAADGIRMVLVGGRADHVQRWRDEATRRGAFNASFVGFVAPSEIIDYQVGADVLVSYYPSGLVLNDFRSPGKLFEYMASGTPIVAADYASLREVLRHDYNSTLVETDKPHALASAIRRLIADPALAERLGRQARNDAGQYTWAARAEAVSDFVMRLVRA
ncbi:MAG: glycosyltransferase family 4 protein [Armatimonadetes bacterium]|nr:glycosyltransferase family 4 protein [Armatimonadota bacterium]